MRKTIKIILILLVLFIVAFGFSFLLPKENFKKGDPSIAKKELFENVKLAKEPKAEPYEPEPMLKPPFPDAKLINLTNNTNNNCDGIIEDGYCISNKELNDSKKSSGSHNDFNNKKENKKEEPKGIIDNFNESSNQKDNNSENKINETNNTINYNDIITKFPEPFKDLNKDLLGNKDLFNSLFNNLEKASEKNKSVKEKYEQFKDIFSNFNNEKLLSNPLLRDMSLSLGKKHTVVGKFFGSVALAGEKYGSFFGSMINPEQYYNSFSDPEERRIDHLETIEKNKELYLRVYFPSYLTMYSYLAITPLSIAIDINDDGVKDYELRVNELNWNKYDIIYGNNIDINNLKINFDDLYIEFKFPITEQHRRVWFWVFEKNSNLRYPVRNSLYYSFNGHSLIKNNIDYLLITIEEVRLKEDGDWFFNGESYFNSFFFASEDIDKLLNESSLERLRNYRNQGVIKDNEVPEWLAYYIMKEMVNTDDLRGRVFLQTSTFPMLKWWSVNDHDTIMRGDWSFGKRSFPIFVINNDLVNNIKTSYFSLSALDDDAIGHIARDLTYWGIRGLVSASTAGASELIAEGIKATVELLYYGVTGESKDMNDIFKNAVHAFYNALGTPDLITTLKEKNKYLKPGVYSLSNNKMDVLLKVEKVSVPVLPLHLKSKINKVHIDNRGDYLFGEFYFYARTCTGYSDSGLGTLTGGQSIVFPDKRVGPCHLEHKLKHDFRLVRDGTELAKDFDLADIQGIAYPFVYLEVDNWDEDNEYVGDNDDSLGIFNLLIPLNEEIFYWPLEENIPSFRMQKYVDIGKSKIDFEITINR